MGIILVFLLAGPASGASLDEAAAAFKREDYESAISMYTEILSIVANPSQVRAQAFAFRGAAYLRQGNLDSAIADFTAGYMSSGMTWDELLYERAVAWAQKGDLEKAIGDYNDLLRKHPTHLRALNNRGSAWVSQGNFDRGIADYSEAIRLNPEFSTPLFARGIASFLKGEFPRAVSDITASKQLERAPIAALWLYVAQARAGIDGKPQLATNTAGVDSTKWPAALVELYLGKNSPNTVLAAASHSDPRTSARQLCDASFFLAQWRILRRERAEARNLLNQALANCPSDERIRLATELRRTK
jgi:lipoprotein NlpI